MATCRYCRKSGPDDTMLKYSTRANAHAACVLERCTIVGRFDDGNKRFARFISRVSNLEEFPILMILDDVPKLEALRDAFRDRNRDTAYAELCDEMIVQRVEELVMVAPGLGR